MPRYFFHVHDGVQRVDGEGLDLAGPAEAHSQAVIAAGEMLKDEDGHFTRGNWSLCVLDEDCNVVSDIMIAVRRRKPTVLTGS